jgi:uncharacterized delta-60 repeat protein
MSGFARFLRTALKKGDFIMCFLPTATPVVRASARISAFFALVASAMSPASHANGFTDFSYFNTPAGFVAFLVEGSSNNNLTAMAIQADGKIVVVGGCRHSEGATQFCAARLTRAGGLDNTFVGPGGVPSAFMLPISAAVGTLPALNESANRVAIQSDGKILIGGTCRQGSERRVCFTRLNTDGSFDTTFGGGANNLPGRRILPPLGNAATAYDSLAGLNVLADGRIAFSGDCGATSSGPYDNCIGTLSSDGISSTNKVIIAKLGVGSLAAQVIDSSGHIMALGSCNIGGATGIDFCATQVNASTLALDPNFDGGDNLGAGNGNGRVSVSVTNGADYLSAAVLQPTAGSFGRTIAAGSCFIGGKYEFCATSFSQLQGRTFLFSGTQFPSMSASMSSGDNFASAVATDDEGRFAIVGQCSDGSRNYFCTVRYRADGTLDATWDGTTTINPAGNGKFVLPPMMNDDRPAAAAYQRLGNVENFDGGLIIAGTCTLGTTNFFCVTRLSSSTNAMSCDLDIDGDGARTATVDGLILTRIMLGMTTNFMTGITVPAGARRNTAAKIRDYLVRQCGFALP